VQNADLWFWNETLLGLQQGKPFSGSGSCMVNFSVENPFLLTLLFDFRHDSTKNTAKMEESQRLFLSIQGFLVEFCRNSSKNGR